MKVWNSVGLAVLLASGCARVVTIEAEVPPLVPGLKNVSTVAVGKFTSRDRTPQLDAQNVASMLAAEIRDSARYQLATPAADAQGVVSGRVSCRITEGTAERQFETLKTHTAEVAVTFTGTAGKTLKVFSVTERPTIEDKRKIAQKLPQAEKLRRALLRACVRSFVHDISPRKVRVKVPRPGLFGPRHTRRGIDNLLASPGEAIMELTKAIEENPEDDAALNALGFCSEVAGNLDLALSSYTYAAALDPRDEYRENMQRVHQLLERRKNIEEAEE